MPREKSRDISRMPTETQEVPVYVQGEQAERQQHPPGVQCGDVTASLGCSHGPCDVLHFRSSPLLSPYLLAKADSVAKLLMLNTREEKLHVTQSSPFLLPFCLYLYLYLKSNIFL